MHFVVLMITFYKSKLLTEREENVTKPQPQFRAEDIANKLNYNLKVITENPRGIRTYPLYGRLQIGITKGSFELYVWHDCRIT